MMKKQKMDFKVIQQWITYQLNHLSYNHIIISTYDVLYIDEMSTMFVLYIGLINIQYIQYIYTCYTYTICIYFSCILCNLIYYTFNMVTWNTLTHDTITPSPPHLSPCYYIYIYTWCHCHFSEHTRISSSSQLQSREASGMGEFSSLLRAPHTQGKTTETLNEREEFSIHTIAKCGKGEMDYLHKQKLSWKIVRARGLFDSHGWMWQPTLCIRVTIISANANVSWIILRHLKIVR